MAATAPVLETVRLADAPLLASRRRTPTPLGETSPSAPQIVSVPAAFGDDVGRALLEAVEAGGRGWDLGMTVYGVVSAERARAVWGSRADGLVADDAAWVLVPIPRTQVPERVHFAHLLIGLSLPGWDGVAFYSEVWANPSPGPGPRLADRPDSREGRTAMWCMAGAAGGELPWSTWLRGDPAPVRGKGTAGWMPLLLRAVVDGAAGPSVPAPAMSSLLCRAVRTGSEMAGWAYDEELADAEALAVASDLFDPAGPLIAAAASDWRPPATWGALITSLAAGPDPADLSLTPASLEWFGGPGALMAGAVNGAPDEVRAGLRADALLADQIASPAWDEARHLDRVLGAVARTCHDIPDRRTAGLVAASAVGDLTADDVAAFAELSELHGPSLMRWGLGNPDPLTRRITLDMVARNVRSEQLAEALERVGDVPDMLAAKVARAYLSMTDRASELSTEPDPRGWPTPMRRIAALIDATPFG